MPFKVSVSYIPPNKLNTLLVKPYQLGAALGVDLPPHIVSIIMGAAASGTDISWTLDGYSAGTRLATANVVAGRARSPGRTRVRHGLGVQRLGGIRGRLSILHLSLLTGVAGHIAQRLWYDAISFGEPIR